MTINRVKLWFFEGCMTCNYCVNYSETAIKNAKDSSEYYDKQENHITSSVKHKGKVVVSR
jgi:copper chaperone CopZ